MSFNTTNGIDVYKPIIMNSNALSGITSITATGDITGNKGSFNTFAITGAGSTWKPFNTYK